MKLFRKPKAKLNLILLFTTSLILLSGCGINLLVPVNTDSETASYQETQRYSVSEETVPAQSVTETILETEISSTVFETEFAETQETPEALESTEETYNALSSLTVTFIDVGQGDSALLECDGHYMLIDGGTYDTSNTIYSILKRKGITCLDYIVATHADSDHTGGLSGALAFADAKRAFCNVTEYDSVAFQNYLNRLKAKGIPLEIPSPGDVWELGSATVKVLSIKGPTDNSNNSIVLLVTHGLNTFLFSADAEYDQEQEMVRDGLIAPVTVLKIGHHGSRSSTSYSYLYHADPEYAVISVGKNNDYGHPTETVLSRLRDQGAKVFRTDMQGDITFVSDGVKLTVSVKKNPDADTLH